VICLGVTIDRSRGRKITGVKSDKERRNAGVSNIQHHVEWGCNVNNLEKGRELRMNKLEAAKGEWFGKKRSEELCVAPSPK